MAITRMLESLSILGVPVTALKSYEHAVACVMERVREREKTFCLAINPEKIYRAHSDTELKRLIHTADFHLCDGVGATIAARILHGQKIGRITGVQLFLDLIARAEAEGRKVFLLGASPESNEGACRKLLEKHPKLKVVGSQHGYFSDDTAMVESINQTRADMLFVAMGSPKQEKWIATHREELHVPYCMGVGGTLDVVSGHVKWAPKIFRKTGLEFLYRLIEDPKRWRRQMVLPKFALMVLKRKLSDLWRRDRERPVFSFPATGSRAENRGKSERKRLGSRDADDRRDAA